MLNKEIHTRMLFCNNGFPVGDSRLSSMGSPGSNPRWQFYALYTLTENTYLTIHIKHISIQQIGMNWKVSFNLPPKCLLESKTNEGKGQHGFQAMDKARERVDQ